MNKTDNQAPQYVILTKEDIAAMQKEAAEIGAKAAMEKLDQEKKSLYHKAIDRRLHNTKLLLSNYRMLQENAEKSVYGRSQMKESAADILCNMMNLYDDEVIVDAIKRSATRTAIIISHVDTMLELYEAYCLKAEGEMESRRYEIIKDLYIEKQTLTVEQIAKKWNVSKGTVYSDIKIAIERLSALIFGVDGLCVH